MLTPEGGGRRHRRPFNGVDVALIALIIPLLWYGLLQAVFAILAHLIAVLVAIL